MKIGPSFKLLSCLLLPVFQVLAQSCPAEKSMESLGLVNLQKEVPGLKKDLKYSSTDNFLKKDIYACLDKAFAQAATAEKLKKASLFLKKKKPGFRFVVYDAARPNQCQHALWNAIPLPESKKHIYVANPKRGSIHNYGCALDLSIEDEGGKALDMGTEFDFFGELAQPRCEEKMRKQGKLNEAQLANRRLLRSCMKMAGFTGTSSEWWHFNACSLKEAKRLYKIIP
jgi:D-alanyl-D-alanine dipeptidase